MTVFLLKTGWNRRPTSFDFDRIWERSISNQIKGRQQLHDLSTLYTWSQLRTLLSSEPHRGKPKDWQTGTKAIGDSWEGDDRRIIVTLQQYFSKLENATLNSTNFVSSNIPDYRISKLWYAAVSSGRIKELHEFAREQHCITALYNPTECNLFISSLWTPTVNGKQECSKCA